MIIHLKIVLFSIICFDDPIIIVFFKDNLNNFISDLKLNSQFSDISLETMVSGIHFYNSLSLLDNKIGTTLTTDPKSIQKSILIADSSNIKSIGGSHHTFSIMALNNLAMRSLYE